MGISGKMAWVLGLSLAGLLPSAAAYQGRVFVDGNGNGHWEKGERLLAGVKVSDGFHVVETDKDGHFVLPGHEQERFVFLTVPSGYMAPGGHYHRMSPETQAYDFALQPYEAGVGKQGEHHFVQVSDTEIFNTAGHEAWVKNIRDWAANERSAFVVHTGDICYEKGLKEHLPLMNTRNMGVPVYYCIGNHDLVKGKYGEELFERIYGPVYYSFEVGNTHYVVTPMPGGDHRPGYTREQVCRWLKNDLAHVPANMSVVVFNHNILTLDDRFVYRGGADSIDLDAHNLKAWIYGHWHINHVKQQGKVKTICTSALDKGGIDHSTSAFRVVRMDAEGHVGTELRYAYLDHHLAIASPQGPTSSSTVVVNAYASASPVVRVTGYCSWRGKTVVARFPLVKRTDWTWTAELELPDQWQGKELQVQVEARLANGERMTAETRFCQAPLGASVAWGKDWDNLLGNAAHTGNTDTRSFGKPRLNWTTNLGANIFMTSPLIHEGKVFTATMDEDLNGKARLCALDGETGAVCWTFPLEHSVKNSIAIGDGKVLAQDVLGHLYAVDMATGQLAWKRQLPVGGLPALIDGLVADEGVVYSGTGKALSAWRIADGKMLWRNDGWSQREGTTATLTKGDGVLIGSVQWGALYGNDAHTGAKRWAASENGLRHRGASAVIHGSLLYIVSGQSFFIIEAATGRIVVRKPLPYGVEATSTPLLTDREIIFGTSTRGLVALDNQTLEEKWNAPVGDALIYTVPYSRPVSASIETSPVCVGRTVYVGASDGALYGFDCSTGRKVWDFHVGAPFLGSVAVSGNVLVANDFGGNVYAFTLEKDNE